MENTSNRLGLQHAYSGTAAGLGRNRQVVVTFVMQASVSIENSMQIILVYVSSAHREMSQQELAELLNISRRNNAALGVTGLLLYVSGNFIQALEGDELAIDGLYRKIAANPRHRMVTTVIRMPTETRSFPHLGYGILRGEYAVAGNP